MTKIRKPLWQKRFSFTLRALPKAVKDWALGSGLGEGCDVGGDQRRFSRSPGVLRRSGMQVREEGRPTLRALGGQKWKHLLVNQPAVLIVTRGNSSSANH